MSGPTLPRLTIREIADELSSAVEFDTMALINLIEAQLGPDLERYRIPSSEALLRRIAAIKAAADAYSGFSKLPASMQATLGVLPD